MLSSRYRRLTPFILLFAWLQALAPAMAAIADARLLDDRTPYAHVESETHTGCVVVDEHDCALCSVATSATGMPADHSPLPPQCDAGSAAIDATLVHAGAGGIRGASQRAPPADRG
jgi:hypothetical protein